jgi:hypothetical protein
MSREVWPLIIGLVSGGAMGAVIKIVYDKWQGRTQGIAKRVKIFPLFDKTKAQGFEAVLKVTHEGSSQDYPNIFVADVTVTNSTRSDFSQFEFGVESPGARCIHVAWENPDQHHTMDLLEPVSPDLPKGGIKLRAQPFNRRDTYSLRLYLTAGTGKPDTPKLTSPHSIRFVDDQPQDFYLFHKWLLITSAVLLAIVLNLVLANIVEINPLLRSATKSSQAPAELHFSSTPPLPANFGRVRPGMKLSQVRAAFPGGDLGTGYYTYTVDDSGPFRQALFYFASTSDDPAIEAIFFDYRDNDTRKSVLASARRQFGHLPHKSVALGSEIIWPDINGFELKVGSFYRITLAGTKINPAEDSSRPR